MLKKSLQYPSLYLAALCARHTVNTITNRYRP